MPLKLGFGDFIGGVRRRIDATGFSLSDVVDHPNEHVPAHTHEHAHFCFIVRGDYLTMAHNRDGACSASTMLFHPPGTTHQDRFHAPGGRFVTLSVASYRLEQVTDVLDLTSVSTAFRDAEIDWLGTKIHRELLSADALSPLVLEGMALELLACTARRASGAERQRPLWLRMACERMREDCTSPLKIREVAQTANVHPVHLARGFRRFLRCTPGEYLRRCRIEHATRLLTDTDRPLAEIALDSGFSDQSQFSKSFKRVMGMPPGAYRTLHA
jgi:AraC family transcriptional regulator